MRRPFPSLTDLASAAAAEAALTLLKTKGTSVSPDAPLFGFREFQSLIGFEEVWDFERRWAREDPHASPSATPSP